MIRLLLWEGAPLAPMAHRWARTIVRKVNTSITLNFSILGLEGEVIAHFSLYFVSINIIVQVL